MIELRKAQERGTTRLPWLDSRHTFSFAEYYDPKQTGFSVLRVINDDRIAGGGGFASHGHRDMEIITYVMQGALEHRDSLGNHSIIPAGDVQRMTAGTGIVHSEFNHSPSEPVHMLQIWMLPARAGLAPGYQQKTLEKGPAPENFRLVVAPDAPDGALTINQDARLYLGAFTAGRSAAARLQAGRRAYFHVTRGNLSIDGADLGEGDGARVSGVDAVNLAVASDAEVLFFDLP
jgi:redox-sensitive bicupin YhaK (pirin superfamily)